MQKLTKEQTITVSGYTGVLCCDFRSYHEEIERRLGRPVLTHQIPSLFDEIRESFKGDFLSICFKEGERQ